MPYCIQTTFSLGNRSKAHSTSAGTSSGLRKMSSTSTSASGGTEFRFSKTVSPNRVWPEYAGLTGMTL